MTSRTTNNATLTEPWRLEHCGDDLSIVTAGGTYVTPALGVDTALHIIQVHNATLQLADALRPSLER